ncbi:MAG: hypothetical protein LBU32_19755 [Clostridiales bacterium]|nr:hypothetical protein [Clostridiales bacterium]
MQSRLPIELRLKGAATIEQACGCLPRLIAQCNARLALPVHSIPSVFAAQPPQEKIDRILAALTERTADAGRCIRSENNYYRAAGKGGRHVYFCKGAKGLAVRALSAALFFSAADRALALEGIPIHERAPENFAFSPPGIKPKKRCVPPASHPWRLDAFANFLKKQPYQSA